MRHIRPVGKEMPTEAKADMACEVCMAFVGKNPMAAGKGTTCDETAQLTTCQKAGFCSMSD